MDGPGAYLARDFERLEDGVYVCQVNGFSPTWIRCIASCGDYFEHVDGGGNLHPPSPGAAADVLMAD